MGVTGRCVECKSEIELLLWLDLFGDMITELIYCFCVGELMSSVHF